MAVIWSVPGTQRRMRKSVERARNLGGFNQSLQHVMPKVLMKQKKLNSHHSLTPKLR